MCFVIVFKLESTHHRRLIENKSNNDYKINVWNNNINILIFKHF